MARNTQKTESKTMKKLGTFIDGISIQMLVVMSIFLGLAPYLPFMAEPPHLFTKLNMLLAGDLTRPIDIFDLVFHGLAPAILTVRLVRKFRANSGS